MTTLGEEFEQHSKEALSGRRWAGWLSSAAQWLDERTHFRAPIRRFFLYPVPLYVHKNLLYSLGGLTLIAITLQITTGILLSFYYEPSTAEAYNSVDYITYVLPLGWLVRGLHVYTASVIVVLAMLHLLRTYLFSAYKKPREITWLSGVLMLLTVLAIAFTGALLPWDQKGYWATKVGIEIASSVPLIGDTIGSFLRGGPSLGQATLSRFYIIHILLFPSLVVLLLVLHIHQLRTHGVSPAISQRGQLLSRKFIPFFPHWMVVDGTLGLVMLLGLIALSWYSRAPLEFPADPSSVDFLPRPEWYFLSLFQLLKYFPGPLEPIATALFPALLVGLLLLVPFLDRGEERRPWRKPVSTAIAVLLVLLVSLLTLLAFISET